MASIYSVNRKEAIKLLGNGFSPCQLCYTRNESGTKCLGCKYEKAIQVAVESMKLLEDLHCDN